MSKDPKKEESKFKKRENKIDIKQEFPLYFLSELSSNPPKNQKESFYFWTRNAQKYQNTSNAGFAYDSSKPSGSDIVSSFKKHEHNPMRIYKELFLKQDLAYRVYVGLLFSGFSLVFMRRPLWAVGG